MGRVYGIHEPAAISAGLKQLTTPRSLRRGFTALPVKEGDELEDLIRTLGFDGDLDENLRADLRDYIRAFYRALNDPASSADSPEELFSTGAPMLSLRDVENQVPVFTRGGRR
jgi:hypothetical protein